MTLHDEAHSNNTSVKRAWRPLLLLVAILMPPVSHAHTAIAQVDGTPHGTLYAAWGSGAGGCNPSSAIFGSGFVADAQLEPN